MASITTLLGERQLEIIDNYSKGNIYFSKGRYEKAFKYFMLAANEGNRDAIFDVGSMYWKGVGVKQDYKKAIEYIKKLSDTGFARASLVIGEILATTIDETEAIKYYEIAVKQGSEAAKERLDAIFERQLEECLLFEIKRKLQNMKNANIGEENE